jgi:3-oxoacyl-[acyl-carrier-protein] synthase II
MEELWRAWLSGQRWGVESGCSGELIEEAARCVAEVLAGRPRAGVGLVVATTKGDIDEEVRWLRRDGERGAVPTLGSVVERIGQGLTPAWMVSTACTSGLVALVDAACAMMDGEANEMVVCGVDAASEFVRQGFGALKAISPAGVCRPFDKDRDGLMLGMGAAACRLARGGGVRVSGWGLAGDATHMTAPDREGRGLARAMETALGHAGVAAEDIDVVFAHGTGTRYNDAMEAVAFEKVFGGLKKKPAITAVKGVIGHALGASGLIEAILAVRMIETQTVPGVVGLRDPEPAELDLVRETRSMRVRHVLKVASGFGGLNAAVVLSAAKDDQ